MKITALVLFALSVTPALAAERLCEDAALKQLDHYYHNNIFGRVEYTDVKVAKYYVGPNQAGEQIVQYEYNVDTSFVKGRYARIALSKRNCSFLTAEAYPSKEAMYQDDADAAQDGAEGQ